jgi:RND family efflux transporter MFP subunit
MNATKTQIVSVVLAAWMMTGCAAEKMAMEKPVPPVRVAEATASAEIPRVRYSANIEPKEQVGVAFKAAGYIRDILQAPGADGRMRNIQEGDIVGRGMVLARVDAMDYSERLNQVRASLREAEAGLQKARTDFERAGRLFASESLTKPEYDAAATSLEVSQARVESAQAVVKQSETALEDTALVAPLTGVVLQRSVEVGSLAGVGTVAFVLADTTSVKAVFGVPDVMMRRARLGAGLSVRTESFGTTDFPGRITAVSPAADASSRVFSVELTIANPRNLLKPGMIATVEVSEREDPTANPSLPLVPLRAVVETPGATKGFAVFVVEDREGKSMARARAVTVAQVFGNQIALSEGIAVGERVVVSGAAQLVDGEEVRVIP